MTGPRSQVCGGIDKHGLSLSCDVFQPLKHIHAADLSVESFDAFNEPFLRFPLTASASYRKHSLSLITGAGTDSALHN